MATQKQLSGIEKQEAFLNKIYSIPTFCPACRGSHSLIELRGNNDWSKATEIIHCPSTGEELVHNVPLIGEDFFSIKK